MQLRALHLKKNYRKGRSKSRCSRASISNVRRGEFLAIIGQSGSGKSTLLHLLGTLDAPDAGEVHFDGRRIDNLPAQQRDALRNTRFGMIFQFYHLLPELTTLENVLSPLMIRHGFLELSAAPRRACRAGPRTAGNGRAVAPPETPAARTVRRRNAADGHRPGIDAGPQILLADEPTGNLDHGYGRRNLAKFCEP